MIYDDFKVGLFLTIRYIRKSNIWTTILITCVIILTFLNLTVIGGLLEGIIVGSFNGLRDRALGDLYISPNEDQPFVERTQHIVASLRDDARVRTFSPRYSTRIEIIPQDEIFNITNPRDKRRTINTNALGVDPEAERATTNLPSRILEGEYFSANKNRNEILIGSALLEQYSPFGADVLSGVEVGDFVYIRIGGEQKSDFIFGDNENAQQVPVGTKRKDVTGVLKKYQVRGIYRTKAGEMDLAVVMNGDEVRGYNPSPANDVSGIAVRLFDSADAPAVKEQLVSLGFGRYAEIKTVEEAIGPFLDDIRTVFQILGMVVGSVGLAVASITIFIIIFVAASSRRKFIGILKAIGITPNAIRISYVLYALSFAFIGTLIGLAILYILLVPFFDANPIPFPFSDGILYITPARVTLYIGLLFFATFIAGLIPSHRIVRQPAIDAVRGR